MTIPTPFTLYSVPAHRKISRHYIFHERGNNMSIMGQTGSKRRPIIEMIRLFGRTIGNGFFEALVFIPIPQNILLFLIGVIHNFSLLIRDTLSKKLLPVKDFLVEKNRPPYKVY